MKVWPQLFLISFLYGCANVGDRPHYKKLGDKGSTIIYSAEYKSVIVKSEDKQQFCSEPPPDSSLSTSESGSESVSLLGKKEGMSEGSQTTARSLGGRNSTVLLAREIFYRICELGVNTQASFDQQKELFLKSLETISNIGNTSQPIGTLPSENQDLESNSVSVPKFSDTSNENQGPPSEDDSSRSPSSE